MDPLIERHRPSILRLAEKHGVRQVRVFGSRARGEAMEESDVDLLVDLGDVRPFFFPGGLVADLEDLLGCRVDVVTPAALDPAARETILADAQVL